MKFKKEDLKELTYLDVGEEDGPFVVVETEQVDARRWVSLHSLIFSFEGKYYHTHYERGLTEYQETYPFEGEPEEIECQEVFRKEKVVTTVYFDTTP